METTDIVPKSQGVANVEHTHSLARPEMLRWFNIYAAVSDETDIDIALSELLCGTHSFSYAQKIAMEVNDKQGKNRSVYTSERRALMESAEAENIDQLVNKDAEELCIDLITIYLNDKMELPMDRPKIAAGIKNRVKSLFITLIKQQHYDLIALDGQGNELDYGIKVPEYIKEPVIKMINLLLDEYNEVISEWMQYLESHENQEVYQLAEVKNHYLFDVSSKTNVDNRFQNVFGELKDEDWTNYHETYKTYLDFMSQVRRLSKDYKAKPILEIFGIQNKEYNKAFEAVQEEFSRIFTENQELQLKAFLMNGK
jgi:hypothetical protein